MPRGTKIGLGPGRIVLHGTQLPFPKGAQPPHQFPAHVYSGQTVAQPSYC